MIIELEGDLWDYHAKGYWVCILTNGEVNKFGNLVMGRGCAKEAADRYPELPTDIGQLVRRHGNQPYIFRIGHARIVTFPTKDRWKQPASITLIIESAITLMDLITTGRLQLADKPIILPRPGCGNGQLDWETEVKPMLIPILDDRVHVIHPPVDKLRLVK